MPPIVWTILGMIWSSVSPALKAAALAELKALEIEEAGRPLIEILIKEAEALVAAA